MSTTTPKTRTITLSDRVPVEIVEDEWPLIAQATYYSDHGASPNPPDRETRAALRVRRHVDGRAIVYATYESDSAWRGEEARRYRHGELVASAGDVVGAIGRLARRMEDGETLVDWRLLRDECIADLPAEQLA